MNETTRWQRLEAAHWVHVLLMVETTLVSLGAVVAIVGLVVMGYPVVALFPVAFVAFAAWLTSAWRRERPWAWWVLTTLSGLGLLFGLGDLAFAGPAWSSSIGLLVNGLFLLLLSHPDSRARIEPAPDSRGTAPLSLGRAAQIARPSSSGRAGC